MAAVLLNHLTASQLSDICENLSLPKSGVKADLVNRVVPVWHTMKKEHLQWLCTRKSVAISGNKSDLVNRLNAGM
jgi:hypothetical protein